MKQAGSPRNAGKRGRTRAKFKKKDPKVSVNDVMKEFELGDKVQVVIDSSSHSGLPYKGFQGLTGEVSGKRGSSFEVKLNKGNRKIMVVTTAVHLKKVLQEAAKKGRAVKKIAVKVEEVKGKLAA